MTLFICKYPCLLTSPYGQLPHSLLPMDNCTWNYFYNALPNPMNRPYSSSKYVKNDTLTQKAPLRVLWCLRSSVFNRSYHQKKRPLKSRFMY